MLVAPKNYLIVTIDKTHQDRTSSGLFISTKFSPEEYATIIGKVHSVPRAIVNPKGMAGHNYDGFTTEDIEPGDTVIMRYSVVHHFSAQPENDTDRYKNQFFYKGKAYWRCDIQHVFAVIRNGNIYMKNGYAMAMAFKKNNVELFLPGTLKRISAGQRTELLYMGPPLENRSEIDAEEGDTIFVKTGLAESYTVNNKEILIIKQKYILGVEKLIS